MFVLSALKENVLFEAIDWDNIHNTAAPFVPNPDDDTDTSYFIGTLKRVKKVKAHTFIYRHLQGNPVQERFTMPSGELTGNDTGGAAQVAAGPLPE